ncbi:hypothetical protein [Paenibacillus hexagrammi]|uniref:Uncharacterized protein n=1 Tax=Paenibacillus hexagrammi TaxID=2908839 RepID=A0ABY3SC17_9BACL|nr:hypothetical protein [Paenibacillus sp. YPD9-1]UJF31322.1 hypothetical protein L0M14_15790 [Paenibacillus sp. YPD9-1]
MKRKALNSKNWSNGKTKVRVRQSGRANIAQGGNAIVVNASEIGVVRIRP